MDDPVRDLERRLARIGVTASGAELPFGAHWSRRETSRRVRVREQLEPWWSEHGFDRTGAAVGKRIALALIERRRIAAKIAGLTILESLIGEPARATDLPAFAAMLAADQLSEPLIDWFAAKVIAPMIPPPSATAPAAAARAAIARTLVDWAGAPAEAQRRCACQAVVPHAHDPAYAPLIVLVCATAVWSHVAGDQQRVGALLKQVAHVDPRRVEAFVRRSGHLMSKPCVRVATAHFGVELRTELLAHWRRATQIRRR